MLIGCILLHTGNPLVRPPKCGILSEYFWTWFDVEKKDTNQILVDDTWTFILDSSLVAVVSLRCSTVVFSPSLLITTICSASPARYCGAAALTRRTCDSAHEPLSAANRSGLRSFIYSSEMALIKHALEIGNEISVYCTGVMDAPNCFIWIRVYIWHASIFKHASGLTADCRGKYIRWNDDYVDVYEYYKAKQRSL